MGKTHKKQTYTKVWLLCLFFSWIQLKFGTETESYSQKNHNKGVCKCQTNQSQTLVYVLFVFLMGDLKNRWIKLGRIQ